MELGRDEKEQVVVSLPFPTRALHILHVLESSILLKQKGRVERPFSVDRGEEIQGGLGAAR